MSDQHKCLYSHVLPQLKNDLQMATLSVFTKQHVTQHVEFIEQQFKVLQKTMSSLSEIHDVYCECATNNHQDGNNSGKSSDVSVDTDKDDCNRQCQGQCVCKVESGCEGEPVGHCENNTENETEEGEREGDKGLNLCILRLLCVLPVVFMGNEMRGFKFMYSSIR